MAIPLMACYHPRDAHQPIGGGRLLFRPHPDARPIKLPCGRCVGCRLEHSRQWAIRCAHEAQLHFDNSYITLTYSEESLRASDPEHAHRQPSLSHRDWQLFAKKLRKKRGPFRYYMAGEYGGKLGRPHFHAILFGIGFADRRPLKTNRQGQTLYTSEELTTIWGNGYVTIGDVSFQSAAYVARYVMKKITGPDAADHYKRVDPETGEVYWLLPEYNRMSLKPGIGKNWFAKYRTDVTTGDSVIIEGQAMRPPKYYDKILAMENPILAEETRMARYETSMKHIGETTPERLATREAVVLARLNLKKRPLE